MHALIEAEGLTKKFGKVPALSELTLTLPAGQPVAILGPNGAGKTTFIRMVATLIAPDRGTLAVNGHDVGRDSMAVRRMIGLAGQSAAVEQMMTGGIDVRRVFGVDRIDPAEWLIPDQFREADDGIQRSAQFMAHVGKELRLGAVCRFGTVLREPRHLGEIQNPCFA